MEEAIRDIEKKDGVRLTWNVWPVSGQETQKVPLACMYNIHQPTNTLDYEPIFCYSCRAIINPQCILDYGNQTWHCVICDASNALPSHARDLSPSNLLPELIDENSTVEYVLNKENPFSLVYMFVVDICTFDAERHKLLIEGLKVTLQGIPDDALVGFIQFGTNIELLELNSEKPRKIYAFSGKTEYTKEIMNSFTSSKSKPSLIGKFLMRKDECNIYEMLETIEKDPFPVLPAYKPVRCTGSAMSLAVSLMESVFQDTGVKYMLFTQGPCTFGPGTVTSIKYKEKGKNDVNEDSDTMYVVSAKKYYKGLCDRITAVGHTVDVLAATIVDIGVQYLEFLCSSTGGMLIMAQDFDKEIYLSSCRKIYARGNDNRLLQGFNAKIQVKTSKNLEFKGVVGQGAKYCTGWRLGSLHPSSNMTFLLDIKNPKNGEFGFVQIITQYQRSDKKFCVRATTFARLFTESKQDVLNSFDQEAVCVFQARCFLLKKYEEVKDLERMVDKSLIRFTKSFANYDKNVPSSLVLPESMSYYPNYMFFFRRSLLVQTENNSPDETCYYKNLLYKEFVNEALKLIKPTLLSYHYQGEIKPVEMDSKSLKPDVILLLDTFHNVVIWRGGYVAQWIKEKYHEKEEYGFLKDILEQSEDRARELCKRLPTPQFCITEQNKSQQRILHHYVNPSSHGVVITENINYDKFFEALCKVVVSNE